MKAMRAVAEYPNQFNALGIVYFAGDDCSEAEALYEQITKSWMAARD